MWHRPREILSGNSPVNLTDLSTSTEAPGSPEFESLLNRENFPYPEHGKLTWLVDGPRFFSELDQQIAAAKHSINIQIYIFDNDDVGVRYADALKRRSSEIPVHVLFDDLGTTIAQQSAPETLGPRGFVPPTNMSAYLGKNSKIHTRLTLNPWLVCDHTKLMIFDQKIALLGGMNIGREYFSEWHDLMVRVEGPIVPSLSMDFEKAWRKAGPMGDFSLLQKPSVFQIQAPIKGSIPLRILRTDPAAGRYEILNATLLAIRGARKRIWIQNPYFANDDIALAVEAAARRGVDVRVLIPKIEINNLMDAGNLSTARGLIKAGAEVYIYPRMTHLKAMICDDWAVIGSANFDTLSMRLNRELNLSFSDPKTIRELEKAVFLPDFRRSKKIKLEDTNSIANDLAETVADQL